MNNLDDIQSITPLSGQFQQAAGAKSAHVTKRKATPPPFSLRLTFEERTQLEREAGDMPLGAYIRSRLFNTATAPRKRERRPVKDYQVLAKVLGELGRSRLANNLNQLAKAANSGSLPVTPDTERELRVTCEAVQAIRYDLIAALGLHAEDTP